MRRGCPTGALGDDPERPLLRFAEDPLCSRLCKATCPEKVISFKPQLDFRAATAMARVLKEEEPFHCIAAEAFGVNSTIERGLESSQVTGCIDKFKDLIHSESAKIAALQ